MEPVRRFWLQENRLRFLSLPSERGMGPLTAPGEMESCVKKGKYPSSGGSVPVRPGSPASSGPRERSVTLLNPWMLMHTTPANIWHGSIPVAEKSQLEKKVPPGRSVMAFFTALNTPRSVGCRFEANCNVS
jgi:hypothetical protein